MAIASGFLVSRPLGFVLFGAVLLHKLPEGFAVGVAHAGAPAHRGGAALLASAVLGLATIAGVVFLNLFTGIVGQALALSAGVTIYVAASDLIPRGQQGAAAGESPSPSSGGPALLRRGVRCWRPRGLHGH